MLADAPTSNTLAPGIRIDYRQLPWTSRFIRDYCHVFDRLAPFFAGSPADPAALTEAAEARRRRRPDAGVAGVIERQLAGRDAPAAARAAAARLGGARSVAVVTGQQAGLFGGPLFTLLKALTTLGLARRLARECGTDVVPIFWIDAEDHDLDEVRVCHVLDRDLTHLPITLDIDAPSGASVASIRLDAGITRAIDQLRAALAPTEFTGEVLDALEAAYVPGVRLVDAFARWLDRLLGPRGLVVFDASDPAAKPFVRSLFAQELDAPGRTARLAADAGAELTALGYHAQVVPVAGSVALFRLDGSRESIRVDGAGFVTGGRSVGADRLLRELDADPASFSPNVLLRPLMQDTLLPTAAYVAGPHELAYLGQLRRVYATFDVPMPVIYPRASATIIDHATAKFLARYGVDLARLQPQNDTALNALLAAQLPAAVDDAMTAAERATSERLEAIRAAVPALDPTLAGAVDATRGRMGRELRHLRGKIIHAAKRRDATLRRQFRRAQAQSFPGGEPQERSVAGVYVLNRYGFALIDRLLDDLPVEAGHHWLLTA